MAEDLERLFEGMPLAYVIGWAPFLGLRIHLDGRPLIPRPETEWWTEKLIAHLKEKFGNRAFTLLDLCAGSGAIGLAVLSNLPNARVTFTELSPEHVDTIRKNARENSINESSFDIRTGDLFEPLGDERFDIIATNPPYIPKGRALPESVTGFEPHEALFAGLDGLAVIRRIASEAPAHMNRGGELWLECDTGHAEVARMLFGEAAELHTDQYGRPRLVVSYW